MLLCGVFVFCRLLLCFGVVLVVALVAWCVVGCCWAFFCFLGVLVVFLGLCCLAWSFGCCVGVLFCRFLFCRVVGGLVDWVCLFFWWLRWSVFGVLSFVVALFFCGSGLCLGSVIAWLVPCFFGFVFVFWGLSLFGLGAVLLSGRRCLRWCVSFLSMPVFVGVLWVVGSFCRPCFISGVSGLAGGFSFVLAWLLLGLWTFCPFAAVELVARVGCLACGFLW